MKKIISKLTSRAGESLVESLLSILIFTLASIAMYSMVTAAADINTTAKETDRTVQEQLVIAEKAEGTPSLGTVTMKLGDVTIDSSEVYIYGGNDGALYAYFAEPAPTEGVGG